MFPAKPELVMQEYARHCAPKPIHYTQTLCNMLISSSPDCATARPSVSVPLLCGSLLFGSSAPLFECDPDTAQSAHRYRTRTTSNAQLSIHTPRQTPPKCLAIPFPVTDLPAQLRTRTRHYRR